jgi:hypothetical protein
MEFPKNFIYPILLIEVFLFLIINHLWYLAYYVIIAWSFFPWYIWIICVILLYSLYNFSFLINLHILIRIRIVYVLCTYTVVYFFYIFWEGVPLIPYCFTKFLFHSIYVNRVFEIKCIIVYYPYFLYKLPHLWTIYWYTGYSIISHIKWYSIKYYYFYCFTWYTTPIDELSSDFIKGWFIIYLFPFLVKTFFPFLIPYSRYEWFLFIFCHIYFT